MRAVNGDADILHSTKDFDWLGSGSYFWEGDPQRANEWAQEKQKRGDCEHPFVIGAAIDLGNCLDLLVRDNLELVRLAHASLLKEFEASGAPMPINTTAPKDKSTDLVMRYLDCAVINHLHAIIEGDDRPPGVEPFDTVRGLFSEGNLLYNGGGFYDKTHSQISVRNPSCIKGIFIPR